MPARGACNRVRNALSVFGRCLGRGALCVLVGCRTAAVPCTAPGDSWLSHRKVVVARQVVEDTAHALTHRPLESCWSLVTETADYFCDFAEGGLGKRFLAPLQGEPPPVHPAAEPIDMTALELELHQLTGQDLNPAHVQLLIDGQEALNALEDLIGRATRSIDVIMFQWDSDPLGAALAARLAAVAGPTLRVRILIDGGGNLFFGQPEDAPAGELNSVLLTLMQHPYIEVVRIRNPFGRYDHRKLVVVDGCIAWSGGRNFSHEAFFEHHDVSFVFEGPLVPRLQQHYDHYWRRQSGHSGGSRAQSAERPATPEPTQPCSLPNALARLLYSEPNNRQMARAIYRAVDLARHHIYVENVYLCDSRLIYKLMQARQRGVDVRVVLTFHSTTEAINRSNKVVANRLLAAGVRVFLYPNMTHVKAITVDGCWAYVGTGNLDPLSFRHNWELGLSVNGSPLITHLEQRLFLPDLRPEWEMTRPVKVGIVDYLAEMAASLCL